MQTITTLKRWFSLFLLSLVGALEFTVLLPVALNWISQVPLFSYYSSWTVILIVGGISVALLRVAMDPIRIYKSQWSHFLKYPPLWVSIVGALGLAAVIQLLPTSMHPLVQPLEWWSNGVWLLLVAILILSLVRISTRGSVIDKPDLPSSEDLEKWIRTEAAIVSPEQDRFRHAPVAERILAHLTGDSDLSVGLIGPYGSGKTGILNLVRHLQERNTTPVLWFVPVSCWGLKNSAAMPSYILERLIASIERFIDCQFLHGLPPAYRRMMNAEPTGRLARFLEPFDTSDPLPALAQLSPILRCLNSRIVVLIEDADRRGSDFDPQQLQRLLWNLKQIERLTFVVATDAGASLPSSVRLDLGKICDQIESVPRLEPFDVKRVISKTRQFNLERHEFIDPAPERESPFLREIDDEILDRIMDGSYGDPAVDAVVSLLPTPRELLHALRRLSLSWEQLHGEVYFDDLFALTVLRASASDAFDFILQHMDAVRQESNSLSEKPSKASEKWRALISSHAQGTEIQSLVDVLGLPQISEGLMSVHPQGVAHMEPVDYLRRVLSMRIAKDEIRDQNVLRDIIDHREHGSTSMLQHLTATWSKSSYVTHWEHFADQLVPKNQLLPIATEIISARVSNIHAAEVDEPLLAVWRRANRELDEREEKHAEWLSEQVSRTLTLSILYATDLYYYWTSSKYGIVSDTGRKLVRTAIYDSARTSFTNPSALRRTLSPHNNQDLRRLMQPTDHNEPASILTSPDDWQWLSPLIVELLREDSSIADHVAALVLTSLPRSLEYKFNKDWISTAFEGMETDLVTSLKAGASQSTMTSQAVQVLTDWLRGQ